MAQKDMFISELLDRIAIVECEVRPRAAGFLPTSMKGVVCCATAWAVSDCVGC